MEILLSYLEIIQFEKYIGDDITDQIDIESTIERENQIMKFPENIIQNVKLLSIQHQIIQIWIMMIKYF